MNWTTKLKRTTEMAVAAAVVTAPAIAMAAGSGGGEHAGGHAAGFDWGGWALQMINFVIFVGIIVYFAKPAAKKFFKERREELVEELEEAERMREEAEARLEEYTAKLEALENKREEMLDEYHEQGEREKERLIEEAKDQIEKMRADAEMTIEQEVRKAVSDLEAEAVDLAVEIARKMAREQLDSTKQHTLIESYVTDLSEETESRLAG